MINKRNVLGLLFLLLLGNGHNVFAKDAKAKPGEGEVLLKSSFLFLPLPEIRQQTMEWMRERNQTDVVAALIYALRYNPEDKKEILKTLRTLTGQKIGADWFKWMLWQQANPQIKPFPEFDSFLSDFFAGIDPEFKIFIRPGVKHEIRLEEIAWGGVMKDGIPAITNPELIPAADATYLSEDEPVFGIEINGDVRAYPYRIMDWHEMFNDVIGGVPVSLAYCTLCGSGILYETDVENRDKPFVFGSSGFLYRSNKLMYDKQTHSLWNQFTGRPVVGELTGSGIELKIVPLVTTTWGKWKRKHPDSKVLSLDTGFARDYTPGRPYGSYFASQDLMFPVLTGDKRLNPKDQVFGLRITGAEKSWPLTAFTNTKIINDKVGVLQIVLIGDAESRTVRAYRSSGRQFMQKNGDLTRILHDGQEWKVTESGLLGPEGENLGRLPGHLAYWFAWSGYLDKAEFYQN